MPKNKKDNRGGARSGSGAKPKNLEKKKQCKVMLTVAEYDQIITGFGTFAAGVRSLLN